MSVTLDMMNRKKKFLADGIFLSLSVESVLVIDPAGVTHSMAPYCEMSEIQVWYTHQNLHYQIQIV